MTNEHVFYCTPSQILRALPCNADIDAALERIEELRREGRVRVVKLREDEIHNAYVRATAPSVEKKYSSQLVFGSLHHPGFLFGRGVPALIVQSASGTIADIFPHRESGRIVTIHEALSRLFPSKVTDLEMAFIRGPFPA
jgi:hypothetical protein